MRLLHLYRPLIPSTRAQDIQVMRACHALADRGVEVTLLANRGPGKQTCWAQMGIEPHPNLRLKRAPVSHSGLAGLWFRHQLARWWSGPPGVVLARDKRRLLAAIHTHGKQGHRVVIETHGLESLLEPESSDAFRVEARSIEVADALVANCGGTLEAWETTHQLTLPRLVSHNGTHIRKRPEVDTQDFILVLGSMRPQKGVSSLLDAAARLPYELRWVGGTETERMRYSTPAHVQLLPPVQHSEVEQLIAQARVLVAPLGDNAFSHRLTSPLKLWDYLASTQPIVTADTACTAEIARITESQLHTYTPGDSESITQTISAAWGAPPRAAYRRSWSTRADELLPILEGTTDA